MKKILSATSLGLLLSALLILPSCFETDESNKAFRCFGTLYGSFASGYTVLSDDGVFLYPTNESILKAVPDLANANNIRRVFFWFNVVGDNQPAQLVRGQAYDINIVANGQNYGSSADDLIDIYDNTAASDTLWAHPQPLVSVSEGQSWVANGYINLCTYFMYSYTSPFSMDLAYNSSCDIDTENNIVTVTLCYNSTATSATNSAYTYFHYRLPDDLQGKLKVDKKVTFKIRGMLDTTNTQKDIATIQCAYADVKETRPTFQLFSE
ncbi:MAG: hypothetical protein Q4E55_02005 [Bacteroidales bacterium]|nr:hypothetical protein [Bacteroidales bacterium]